VGTFPIERTLLLAAAALSSGLALAGEPPKECVLDNPGPVFTDSGFRLDQQGRAREQIRLSSTVTVSVEQSQCEYVTRTFTFLAKKNPLEQIVAGADYRKAADLLAQLENVPAAKITFPTTTKRDLADARKALTAYAKLLVNPRQKDELVLRSSAEQFNETVMLRSTTSGDVMTIAVTISSGPY
jgi:hypothetical protein